MNVWKTFALSEISDIRISNVDKKSAVNEAPVRLCNYMDVYSNDYLTADIDYMEATATVAEREKFKVEQGDVLITKDSETPDDIGIPAVVVDEINDLVCGYHLALIKPKKSIVDPIFLAKQLSSAQTASYFSKLAAGSTRYGLSNGAIEKTVVHAPSLASQKRIGAILQTIDQAIEHTTTLIEKYQKIKAGLMHDLFTRGIGTDGQLRPPREQAPELYQQAPIGWIPKEWEFGPIGGYLKSVQYGVSTSLDERALGIPVLRMNNIQSNRFDVSDLKYSRDPEAYKVKLSAGDVLYNRTNSIEHVGKTAIWRDELVECSFASYLVRLNLRTEILLPEFFSHWMSQVSSQNALRVYATPGVQQVNINPTNLQRVVISLPCSRNEQSEISQRIDAIDCRIEQEIAILNKLQKQKSGLMHDLLTGKVLVIANTVTKEAADVQN